MKSCLRILLFFWSFIAISEWAYCQIQPIDFTNQLQMPQVVPASPDAAAIEKFGNIPVDYSTGVPNISIPIWTIKCGNLNWPISLAYHAGGIRVDESASCVGLGWALNGQAAITRTVCGRNDEEALFLQRDYTAITNNDFEYLYGVTSGIFDAEQDIFNFNFNGRSGKFVINPADGSIVQIPLSDLKISYSFAGSALNNFSITDENGVVYYFDQPEYTDSHIGGPSPPPFMHYISTWYLTKVEMPDKKNSIQFTYTDVTSLTETYWSFSQAVGEKYIQIPPSQEGEDPTAILEDKNELSPAATFVQTGLIKLTGISFPNGSMEFIYDDAPRQDLGDGTDIVNKLSFIKVNGIKNSLPVQIKSFRLNQSYFYYNPDDPEGPATSPKQYRLRLDGVSEFGKINDFLPKNYTFEYNSTPMVPRGNYGQDIWGFNNGHWQNQSLLNRQHVTFANENRFLDYDIGYYGDSREVDTVQMKAWILSSIIYPTGGKTEFVFDAHQYNTELTTITPVEPPETHISGDQTPQFSTTPFTYPTNGVVEASTRLVVDMSKFDFTGVTHPSVVSLTDLTANHTIYLMSQPDPTHRFSIDEAINLEGGHNYELKATVYTSVPNSQLNASIKVEWSTSTTQPDIRKGGGLRIREIKNYTDEGVLAGKETYVYDDAITLSPFYRIQRDYSEVLYRLGVSKFFNELSCDYYYSPTCRVYHSSSIYPISTVMGSPMLYNRVQKVTTDVIAGGENGKTEYLYDIIRDENYPIGGRYAVIPFITNEWQNGFLRFETHYKLDNEGSYAIVKRTENKYAQFNLTQGYSLKVQGKIIREGCSNISSLTVFDDLLFAPFPIRSGSKRLSQQIVTLFDNNQNSIETHTYNDYTSDKYEFPTKTRMVDSKGNENSVVYKHPPDFAETGNVYEKMEQKNIIAPVVEQTAYKTTADDITTVLNTVKTNYVDWHDDEKVFSPQTVESSILGNETEPRLQFYDYDAYNNPRSVSKVNDVNTCYLWGYNYTYPVAKVVGSDLSTVQALIENEAILINEHGEYTDEEVRDELNRIRTGLGATKAQVTTYTFAPLVGITSQTDPNGRTTFYEYDYMNRLRLIRDQDNNILKKFCYNYSGQSESCQLFTNQDQTGDYIKNDCGPGYEGVPYPVTIPAGTFFSTISIEDANNQATQYGQQRANENGSCTPLSNTIVLDNGDGALGYRAIFTKDGNETIFNFPSSGTANFSLPSGIYTISVAPAGGPGGNHRYELSIGGSPQTGTDATWADVNVGGTLTISIVPIP